MGSLNTIKFSGRMVEWYLGDSSAVNAATGKLYWWSTAGGDVAASAGQTETYWYVQTITYMPATGAATGTYVALYENTTAGVELFRASMMTGEDVNSQTYNPPLRCRPMWSATGTCGEDFVVGGKFVFHLA